MKGYQDVISATPTAYPAKTNRPAEQICRRPTTPIAGRSAATRGWSRDGRIAGPGDSLECVHEPRPRTTTEPVPRTGDSFLEYDTFFGGIGSMLMGRRSSDVVSGFDRWPYGTTPVVVLTSRRLTNTVDTVRVATHLDGAVTLAREAAGGRHVYADGGRLVMSLLSRRLLHELTTTVLPTLRGEGIGLFDGLGVPVELDIVRVATSDDGAVQLTWRPARASADATSIN